MRHPSTNAPELLARLAEALYKDTAHSMVQNVAWADAPEEVRLVWARRADLAYDMILAHLRPHALLPSDMAVPIMARAMYESGPLFLQHFIEWDDATPTMKTVWLVKAAGAYGALGADPETEAQPPTSEDE